MQAPQFTKKQVEKKISYFQNANAELLEEMQVQRQEQMEIQIGKLIPDDLSQQVVEELTYGSFSFADPLRWVWEMCYLFRLQTLKDQVELAFKKMMTEQLWTLSFIMVLGAYFSFQFEMAAFQIISLLSLQIGILQLCQIGCSTRWRSFSCKLVSSADRMELGSSNSSGNAVRITRSLYDKVSYIEKGIMYLTADKNDMVRQMYQQLTESWGWKGTLAETTDRVELKIISIIKSWVAARTRFRGIASAEIAATRGLWAMLWRMQKDYDGDEGRKYKELVVTVAKGLKMKVEHEQWH